MLSSPRFAFSSLMNISQSVCLSLWFIILKTDQRSYCGTTFSYGTWRALSRYFWLDLNRCPWIAGGHGCVLDTLGPAGCWLEQSQRRPDICSVISSLSSLSAALMFYFPVNPLIYFFVVILLPKGVKHSAVLVVVPCDALDETTSFMDIWLDLSLELPLWY